jgi:hypothetical protein
MSAGRGLVDAALRCYPKWWTERYGEEMRAVIDDLEDDGRSETRIAVGLLRDALRSRFQARGMPRTYGLLASRTRTSVATGTLPWLAVVPFVTFVTAKLLLVSSSGFVENGYPFQLTTFGMRVIREPGMHWVPPSIPTSTWVIGASVMTMDALYAITFFILAIGLGAWRYGIVREKSRNRRWMYLLTWLPLASVVLFYACDIAKLRLNDNSHRHQLNDGQTVFIGGHTAVAAFMGDMMWVVAIGGWLLSMVALAIVAKRANLPPETLRLGRTVSVLTSASLFLTFLAFVVWGVALDVQNHQSHVAGAITATYPRLDLWLPMAVVLGLTSVVSLYGATTARRSWRTIYAQRLWDT